MNPDRKKGGDLNKVTYEAFEILMDRLEKEWIDLVRILGVPLFRAARTSLETNPLRTPRYREMPLPESSLSQRKKVSIEEWRNSVIEGAAEIREIQVQDASEWEVKSSSF